MSSESKQYSLLLQEIVDETEEAEVGDTPEEKPQGLMAKG